MNCVMAVGLLDARGRGHLPVSARALQGWDIDCPAQQHPPMPAPLAMALVDHLLKQFKPKEALVTRQGDSERLFDFSEGRFRVAMAALTSLGVESVFTLAQLASWRGDL